MFVAPKLNTTVSRMGGKTRAIPLLRSQVPPGIKHMLSPFFGGGSFEVRMARRGTFVRGYDMDMPLTCFWHFQINDRQRLYVEIKRRDNWSKIQKAEALRQLYVMPFNIETAATYYILSKSVYGGVFTGGFGSRYATSRMIENIRRFNLKGKLSVEMVDFREAFERHPLMFAYLDPPYLLEGKKECYYGEKGILHSQFDHDALFEVLKDRPNWIMSYGDHPTIRAMYQGFQMTSPSWKYGVGDDKSSRELLIYSKDLSPR